MSVHLLRQFLVAALVVGATAALNACGDDEKTSTGGAATTTSTVAAVPFAGSPEAGLPTEYPPPKPAKLTVGFLNPNRATEVAQLVFEAAGAEVKRLGGTSIELDAQLNPDNQISQFQQLLNRKVDAIGIAPIAAPNVLRPLLERAAKEKVPVIGFDITPGKPAPIPGFASQIWQQRDRLAYVQVREAARALPRGSEVALIGLAVPIPLFEYTAARQRHWAQEFGLRIVDQAASRNDTVVGGEQAATGLLAKNPDLKAIIGYNDEPAIGAALAARAAGRRDVITFGITGGSLGRAAIKDGRLKASVYGDPVDNGIKLAQGLYDAAQGVTIPPVVLAGKPYVVTEKNVDEQVPTSTS